MNHTFIHVFGNVCVCVFMCVQTHMCVLGHEYVYAHMYLYVYDICVCVLYMTVYDYICVWMRKAF